MTAAEGGPLRIALVDHSPGSETGELAEALRASRHHADVLSAPVLQPIEKLLRYRGFATPLTHVPFAVAALRRGGYDVAQAFSPQDAAAALRWRRLGGGRVVFSPAEPPRRDALADRRLSLRLVQRALGESDAVIALTGESRTAFSRWLALDVPLIEPGDAPGWERLYRSLLEPRA